MKFKIGDAVVVLGQIMVQDIAEVVSTHQRGEGVVLYGVRFKESSQVFKFSEKDLTNV